LKQFKDLDINALKTKLEELKEEQRDDSGYLKALVATRYCQQGHKCRYHNW
jgi:hypothetical protein